MAQDRSLLAWIEGSSNPVTLLRFYRWSVPTVSLGRNQAPHESVCAEFCRCAGIPIVERPTGGRAVLHDLEVTYSLVSNDFSCFPERSLRNTYHRIATALKAGLERLGVQANLADAGRGARSVSRDTRPCFATTSRSEILCRNRKLAGSAQRRLRRSFLQHGSIPLHVDYAKMAAALGVSPRLLRDSLISISEAAGRSVPFEEAARALRLGFETTFSVRLDAVPSATDYTRQIAPGEPNML